MNEQLRNSANKETRVTKTKIDIQKFITGTLKEVTTNFGNGAADVAPEANLLENGFIDSLGFVSLMSAIEQAYDIELDFDEADPKSFTTIQGLVDCTAQALDEKK